jgi:catechol-2,3-dioxygenase
MLPKLNGFDHIHLYVKDRAAAADWYQQVLGFKITESARFWAEHPQGPLTIEDASGKIHLALFAREDVTPSSAIAYGTDGEAFMQWKAYFAAQNMTVRCSDHQISWSLYFNDLDGNMSEITTYDHAHVAQQLPEPASE